MARRHCLSGDRLRRASTASRRTLLLIVSFFVFALTLLLPGDPARLLARGQNATAEQVTQVRHQLGLAAGRATVVASLPVWVKTLQEPTGLQTRAPDGLLEEALEGDTRAQRSLAQVSEDQQLVAPIDSAVE